MIMTMMIMMMKYVRPADKTMMSIWNGSSLKTVSLFLSLSLSNARRVSVHVCANYCLDQTDIWTIE